MGSWCCSDSGQYCVTMGGAQQVLLCFTRLLELLKEVYVQLSLEKMLLKVPL